ncbi:MAG: Bax inhibitor-1/YccA family protein [Pseudomonadota bacterium]
MQTQAIGTRSTLETNKLIRSTYTLLSMTLLFSAAMAAVSMAIGATRGMGLVATLVGIGLLWFALPRTANSGAGIGVVFAFTGLLGFGLGPIISFYLSLPNGGQTVMMAMGGTGAIFLGLSGYALSTRRDFSFMGGFLGVGLIVVVLAMLANLFFQVPAVSLAMAAAMVLLMSGLILYETSQMVHGYVDNYIVMTANLFLSIINLFQSLLMLLGFAGGDD